MIANGGEPETYWEVMTHERKRKCLRAMQNDMKSLHENYTYDFLKLPKDKRTLKNKWVFKLNIEENNSQLRYKTRLVMKGFS